MVFAGERSKKSISSGLDIGGSLKYRASKQNDRVSQVQDFERRLDVMQKQFIEAKKFLSEMKKQELIWIPYSVFKDEKLSAFELVVKYLKEIMGLRNITISKILNRNPKTVWVTYNNCKRKSKKPLQLDSEYAFPVKILSERKLSVLESIVVYASEVLDMDLENISSLTHRKKITIITILRRARLKLSGDNIEQKKKRVIKKDGS